MFLNLANKIVFRDITPTMSAGRTLPFVHEQGAFESTTKYDCYDNDYSRGFVGDRER